MHIITVLMLVKAPLATERAHFRDGAVHRFMSDN